MQVEVEEEFLTNSLQAKLDQVTGAAGLVELLNAR